MTSAEAAVRFRIEWDTSNLELQGANVGRIQDRIIEGQLNIARAVATGHRETDMAMVQVASSSEVTGKKVKRFGSWFNNSGTVEYLDQLDSRLVHVGDLMTDINKMTSDPDSMYPSDVNKRGKRGVKITKDNLRSLGLIRSLWSNINSLANNQWTRLLTIEGVLERIFKKHKKIRSKSAGGGGPLNMNNLMNLSIGAGTILSSATVDKTIADLRDLRKEGALTVSQIDKLPTLFNRLIADFEGRVKTNELEQMTKHAVALGVEYKRLPIILFGATEARLALSMAEDDAVAITEKMLDRYKLTENQFDVLIGQAQHFGREGRMALADMGKAIMGYDELVYQLDKKHRFEGIRQLSALTAGLSQMEIDPGMIEPLLKSLRNAGTSDPKTASFLLLLGLDPKQIAREAKSGKYIPAFQKISDGIYHIMNSGNEQQIDVMRRLLEEQFNFSSVMSDRIRREQIDFQKILTGGSNISRALLEAENSGLGSLERTKTLLGTFATSYGQTFQPIYEGVTGTIEAGAGAAAGAWQPIPKIMKDVVHWLLLIGPLFFAFRAKGRSIRFVGNQFGKLNSVLEKTAGVSLKNNKAFKVMQGLWIYLKTSLKSFGKTLVRYLPTLETFKSFFSFKWLARAGRFLITKTGIWGAVIIGLLFLFKGLHTWFKKFQDLGGMDHYGEGVQAAAGAMRLLKKDGHQGMLAVTTNTKEAFEWMVKLTNIIEESAKGRWWIWVLPNIGMFIELIKIFNNNVDSIRPHFQKIEDTVVGTYLIFKDVFDDISFVVGETWKGITSDIRSVWKAMVDFVKGTQEKFKSWENTIVSIIRIVGHEFLALYEKYVEPWAGSFVEVFKPVVNVMKKLYEWSKKVFDLFANGIKDGFLNMPGIKQMIQLKNFFGKAEKRGRNYRLNREARGLPMHAPIPRGKNRVDRMGGTVPTITRDPRVSGDFRSSPEVPYQDLINAASTKHGVDARLIAEVIRAESNFNSSAFSRAGAMGLMQLMPGTASDMAKASGMKGFDQGQLFDAATNIELGTRYLREQLDRFGGDPQLALAAYNAGPGNVNKYGGVPPFAETQGYVRKIMNQMQSHPVQSSSRTEVVVVSDNSESNGELVRIRQLLADIKDRGRDGSPNISPGPDNTVNSSIIDQVSASGI